MIRSKRAFVAFRPVDTHQINNANLLSFVDRYIPGYVFFGDGVTEGGYGSDGQKKLPPWRGHSLKVQINESREVVEVSHF